MEERKFKRYKITIGKPLKVAAEFFSPQTGSASNDRWIDLEQNYKGIGDKKNGYVLESSDDGECFSISFDCIRKSGTNAECSIDIFNLDDHLTKYIIDNSDQDLVVKIEAGYNSELFKVIEGTVTEAYDHWSQQDRTLSLVIEDSAVNKREAYTVRSYSKNTPFSRIINDLIGDMAIKKGVVANLEGNPVTKVPLSLAGNPNAILRTLAKKYSHTFTINDQHASFLADSKRLKTISSYISADTGLVDNATKRKRRKRRKKHLSDDMITFNCQLDASIYPDSSIWLKDNTFDTAVKIEKCRLRGAYPRGEWICIIDGSPCGDTLDV